LLQNPKKNAIKNKSSKTTEEKKTEEENPKLFVKAQNPLSSDGFV
jgi:hypothetical protein